MTLWPADPDGDMTPILEASVEAAKTRHPSGVGKPGAVQLTAADRCDNNCGAGAAYRVAHKLKPMILDFCGHHFRKHFPAMVDQEWAVVGGNPDLLTEQNRLKGSDH